MDWDIDSNVITFKRVMYWILLLMIFSVITVCANYVGYRHPMMDALVGMFILSGITLLGLLMERLLPYQISNIIYISIIGCVLALPFMPTASFVNYYVSKVDLISICTVFLAYVGIGIGREWKDFKKIGWRGIIVTIFVISGTYICSATVAQIVLILTGAI